MSNAALPPPDWRDLALRQLAAGQPWAAEVMLERDPNLQPALALLRAGDVREAEGWLRDAGGEAGSTAAGGAGGGRPLPDTAEAPGGAGGPSSALLRGAP